MIYRLFRVGAFCLLGGLGLHAQCVKAEVNEFVCGPLQNAFGPFDFRTDKSNLVVVEGHHFTPEVANLVSGVKHRPGSGVGTDIDYTLRAYPNHPGALMAIVRYGEREKTEKPRGTTYSVECYLDRASRFRPDDGMVRVVYATYLAKRGRNKEALDHLNEAIRLGESSANLNYNIGLIYFDLKNYDESLVYAHKAYRMGFPLPGLRDKLKKISKWKEPEIIVPEVEKMNISEKDAVVEK